PVAVLYGDRRTPYLRADAYYWRPADPADRAAAAALARLAAGLTGALRDVTLAAGDYCFLNNHKVVHGRRPFRARYDGTDRWLKRVCIARDLRRSREARSSVLSQVMT
ncbi:MAG TPA: TauD/TfdA family dioxygenase, partial [Actinophytocola sp.]|uniref:TauD/TfdA family dioxygenase n=1 Tax=Actinophytocola sp. TaxID=1872138 RepID=UPI002DDC9AA0